MIVLTIGTFDLFHYGHYKLLERAAKIGTLLVGVNSDRFVEEYKGRLPAQNEEERLRCVRQQSLVQWVDLNDGPGDDMIRQFRPNLLVVGSDWHGRYLPQINMTADELFDDLRCGVVYLPRTSGVSTTVLRA